MKNLFSIVILVIFFSCEEEVDVQLKNPVRRLVVEGRVEKIQGVDNPIQSVTLSWTNDYFDSNATPRVRNARVIVLDPNKVEHIFNERTDKPGTYINTTLKGEIGATYTLRVEVENQVYEASETLVAVPTIEDIYTEFQEETIFEDAGIKVLVDFTDPVDIGNYYLWEQFVDGKSVLKADPGNRENVILSDRLFNGQSINGYVPNEESLVLPGQEVLVRQIGLSKAAYDYYYLIFTETGKTGQLFDTPPATIRGNVANVTNPDNYALGYFGAHEVSEGKIVVE